MKEDYDIKLEKLMDKLFDAVGDCNFKQVSKIALELDKLQENHEKEMKKPAKEARKG